MVPFDYNDSWVMQLRKIIVVDYEKHIINTTLKNERHFTVTAAYTNSSVHSFIHSVVRLTFLESYKAICSESAI